MDEERLSLLTPEQLQIVSGRLLRELKEARDRLNQSSSNSSKPPSTRAPWDDDSNRVEPEVAPRAPSTSGKTPAPPTSGDAPAPSTSTSSDAPAPPAPDVDSDAKPEPGKSTAVPSPNSPPSAKKAGKLSGAKGFGRTQKLAITHTGDHFPPSCAACDKSLPHEGAKAYTGRDEIDIAEKIVGQVGLFLRVTRHRLHDITCACGHVTRASHHAALDDLLSEKVDLGEWRLIGPRLAGAIVFMSLRMRLSCARIQEFLKVQGLSEPIDARVVRAGKAMRDIPCTLMEAIYLARKARPGRYAKMV